jgi:hypothetical protein
MRFAAPPRIGSWIGTLALLATAAGVAAQAAPWQPLFNGEDLSGWVQRNGSATYEVEGEAIAGTAVAGSPNSFLCTEVSYGDFILEYEVWLDDRMNSGVQIRSRSRPDYRDGRVHGYQVEIDPSDRAWTGGIYDEARRGWLYPLGRNEPARRAFRRGEWNRFRVEAIGNRIRTWVNGIPCADLVDETDREGFIALQVHGIGNDASKVGIRAKWRRLRILTDHPANHALPEVPEVVQVSYLENRLTEREAREGWTLLFDGRTSRGWRGARLDGFPEKGWAIEHGTLTVLASGGAESAHGGDIVTVEPYRDFELEVDFRYTEGANSGIKYFVDPTLNRGPGSAIGCEFQILDDRRHPDAKKGVNGNRTLASLYDLIPARDKRDNGPNAWNRARIVVRGRHVEHWLNQVKVLEYERATDMWRALVACSKYARWPAFGEAASGHILLQDHGDRVSFKSVKIRKLD